MLVSYAQDRRSNTAKKAKAKQDWTRKAEEQLDKQKLHVSTHTYLPTYIHTWSLIWYLQVEDLVWIRSPAELAGSRAIVVQTTGVPGLNRIR